MSNRLDQEREQTLQPKRMEYACKKIAALGFVYMADNTKICFTYKGHQVSFYPYSGWHTGKSIKDGRGLENLLKQITTKTNMKLKLQKPIPKFNQSAN